MVILTAFQYPESPILHEQQNTRAVLDKRDLGVGTVYVSERTLCWKKYEGAGFCIEYPHISMHAITTDQSIYPSQCIFIMIDGVMRLPGDPEEHHERNEDDDSSSESDTTELVLVPTDTTSIDTIYNALNQCQLLNPDPDDMIDEEENVYEDAEDYLEEITNNRINNLGAGGDTEMNNLSSQLQNHYIHSNQSYGNGDQNFDDDQFEDAD